MDDIVDIYNKLAATTKMSKDEFQKSLQKLGDEASGNLQAERKSQAREIDLTKIPDYELIKQILPNWFGGRKATVGTGPTTGYTYGHPADRHNTPGETNVKSQKIGLESSGYLGDLLGNPNDLATLTHELTHVYQGRKIRDNAVDDQKALKNQQNNIDQFKPFFKNLMATTPTAYNLDSPNHEIEATIFGGLMRNLMHVKRQEEQQQKFAPELRPK